MAEISIIIPIYNAEEYLRECLDSAVNQTLQDIEIILVYLISQMILIKYRIFSLRY